MTTFSLPANGEFYTHSVKDRCVDLIKHDVWDGIELLDFKTWFKNFKTKNEKYFAACVLDSLIYRCAKQEISMATEIFTKKIVQYLNDLGFSFTDYTELITVFSSNVTSEFQFRLVTVANAHDRPGKSAEAMIRMYRRKLGFNSSWFIKPNEVELEISNGIKVFIFIDDFLGTGKQFKEMWNTKGFSMLLKNSVVIYCPLVAHVQGVSNIKELDSRIKVVASEYLDEKSDLFKYAFDDGINTEKGAREFYKLMLEKYKFVSLPSEDTFGFGNLGLAYTFNHGSPDNCLHIIWESVDGWKPLIKK